jgi:hypothetical protein
MRTGHVLRESQVSAEVPPQDLLRFDLCTGHVHTDHLRSRRGHSG